jgi:hypothetical protein
MIDIKGRDYKNQYGDIIGLPAHKSKKRPPMSLSNRAAQFAPFSALVGHKEIINETARQTGQKTELEEDAINRLNRMLRVIQEEHLNQSEVAITYFVPDGKKDGGAYIRLQGIVKKINQIERYLVMIDGAEVPLDDIFQVEL